LLLLLVILALFTIGAWLHSSLVGWEQTWANPGSQQGGRLVSSQGQFIVQSCDLTPPPGFEQLFPNKDQGGEVEMPKDFTVGSNAEGERTVIAISGLPVPFARPDTGIFLGSASNRGSLSRSQGGKVVWWYSSWDEWVIAYWLPALLLILLPLGEGIRWLCRGRKQKPEAGPSAAG
jgi:hypothetical protein